MRKSFGSIAATATGRPIQGAQVSLYQADHVTPVIIYSDNANPPTQITEGLFTDAKGYWEFYANSGTYSLKQDNPGEDTKWIDGYEIYDDAQQEDGIARSIKVPAGETVATLPAAADRANKYAAFDNAGALIVSDAVGFSQAAGDALTNRVAITENEIGALQSSNGVAYLPYDTWADYVAATSAYNSGATYSKGLTLVDQGVMWIYINAVAGAGHAPPALPAVSDAYWRQFRNPLEGQVFQIPVTDTGTHTDPTNGATVPNTGIHVWATGVSGTGAHYLYPTDAALAKPFADAAAASAILAGHYANDDTDTDVPGGNPGDRGAHFWSDTAKTFAPILYETTDTASVWWLLDSGGRVLSEVLDAASLDVSTIPVAGFYETTDPYLATLLLESGGHVLAEIDTGSSSADTLLASMAGSQPNAAIRLNNGLTPGGDPVGPTSRIWRLRDTRLRLGQCALGESTQFVMVMLGDSYIQKQLLLTNRLAKRLQTQFGMAGLGWISFAFNSTSSGPWSGSLPSPNWTARADLVTYVGAFGTWSCNYHVTQLSTPELCVATSSTPGDYFRWNFTTGHTSAILHYGASDGSGVVQVSWDDGATWSANIALSIAAGSTIALAAPPATAGFARLKVISGSVAICGVDMQSTADGVRLHKVASGGSTAQQWASVTQATWASYLGAFAPHFVSITLGTNDETIGRTSTQFAADIATIVTNIRSVLPYCDIEIIMPQENNRTTVTPLIPAYAQAVREYVINSSPECAYLDLQFYFGSPANFGAAYAASNSARPWMDPDLVHASSLGGAVQEEGVYRSLVDF